MIPLERAAIVKRLSQCIAKLVSLDRFGQIIPEVGSNFVFSLPNPQTVQDVAGLTGRIILVRGQPQAVGEVDFGWAPYMAIVILKANQLDNTIRSAISLRCSVAIVKATRRAGYEVAEYRLPEEEPVPECMTLASLKALQRVPQILYDRGAQGIEPLVVIFGKGPAEVVSRVQGILTTLDSVG